MEQPIISVIVPVYNVEEYLEECVNSLVNQTLKNIEVILVNNGHSDNSVELCRKYSGIYENIKMIDMESKGVSAARNAGIDAADGKYIGFVDADDWVENDMFSVLCEKAESANADIAICNYYRNNGKIQNLVSFNINKNVLKNDEISKKIITRFVGRKSYNESDDNMAGSVCRCIFKKTLLCENSMHFHENLIHSEDLIFCIEAFSAAKTVAVAEGAYYHYRYRKSSVSHSKKNELNGSLFEVIRIIDKKFSGDAEIQNRISLMALNTCKTLIKAGFNNKNGIKNAAAVCGETEIMKIVNRYRGDERLNKEMRVWRSVINHKNYLFMYMLHMITKAKNMFTLIKKPGSKL